jgi:hypothetical protein
MTEHTTTQASTRWLQLTFAAVLIAGAALAVRYESRLDSPPKVAAPPSRVATPNSDSAEPTGSIAVMQSESEGMTYWPVPATSQPIDPVTGKILEERPFRIGSRMPDYSSRRKVERATADLEKLARMIEKFYCDHHRFPARRLLFESAAVEGAPLFGIDPGELKFEATDPFVAATYAFHFAGERWILISAGPDGDYDIDPTIINDPSFDPRALLDSELTYNADRGAFSGGDIWRYDLAPKCVNP